MATKPSSGAFLALCKRRCERLKNRLSPPRRLPMYNEGKVLYVVWLWHPRTQARGAESNRLSFRH